MIGWHVTPTRNIESIQANGLHPQIGVRSKAARESVPAVFLFSSAGACEDGLMNWMSDEFDDNEPLSFLKIDLTGMSVRNNGGWEIEVREPLAAELILETLTEQEFPEQHTTQLHLTSSKPL